MASDMLDNGAPLSMILRAGGWRSGAFLSYLTRSALDRRKAIKYTFNQSDSEREQLRKHTDLSGSTFISSPVFGMLSALRTYCSSLGLVPFRAVRVGWVGTPPQMALRNAWDVQDVYRHATVQTYFLNLLHVVFLSRVMRGYLGLR